MISDLSPRSGRESVAWGGARRSRAQPQVIGKKPAEPAKRAIDDPLPPAPRARMTADHVPG